MIAVLPQALASGIQLNLWLIHASKEPFDARKAR